MNSIILELILVLAGLNAQLEELKIQYAEEQKKEQQIEIQSYILDCESKGNPNAVNKNDAKITGYPSKGLYQFQPKTFLNAGLKYKILPPGTILKDVDKYIYKPAYNGAVAHALIENGEVWHWKFCYSRFLAQAKNDVPLYLR